MSQHRYTAFGLELVSEVELPGLSASVGGAAPPLAIELVEPDTLAHAWSGPGASPVWHSRSRAGSTVTGELGLAGDFLLRCEGQGQFLLSSNRSSLRCAPLHSNGGEWRRFLLDTVLMSTALLSGFPALHASAVNGPRGAVAFMSPAGGGKTTIAAELVRRGYPLVADDVVVLEGGSHTTVVHPGPGVMNLPVEAFWSAGAVGRVLGLFGDEVWVEAASAGAAPVPIAALVMIERREGTRLTCERTPASALDDLLPHARRFNFVAGSERQAFRRMGDLADNVPLYRLRGDQTHVAAELADTVEGCVLAKARPAAELAP